MRAKYALFCALMSKIIVIAVSRNLRSEEEGILDLEKHSVTESHAIVEQISTENQRRPFRERSSARQLSNLDALRVLGDDAPSDVSLGNSSRVEDVIDTSVPIVLSLPIPVFPMDGAIWTGESSSSASFGADSFVDTLSPASSRFDDSKSASSPGSYAAGRSDLNSASGDDFKGPPNLRGANEPLQLAKSDATNATDKAPLFVAAIVGVVAMMAMVAVVIISYRQHEDVYTMRSTLTGPQSVHDSGRGRDADADVVAFESDRSQVTEVEGSCSEGVFVMT